MIYKLNYPFSFGISTTPILQYISFSSVPFPFRCRIIDYNPCGASAFISEYPILWLLASHGTNPMVCFWRKLSCSKYMAGVNGFYITIWLLPKMVTQQPWVFLLKMISTWGVKWGYHHFRKPPYIRYPMTDPWDFLYTLSRAFETSHKLDS